MYLQLVEVLVHCLGSIRESFTKSESAKSFSTLMQKDRKGLKGQLSFFKAKRFFISLCPGNCYACSNNLILVTLKFHMRNLG